MRARDDERGAVGARGGWAVMGGDGWVGCGEGGGEGGHGSPLGVRAAPRCSLGVPSVSFSSLGPPSDFSTRIQNSAAGCVFFVSEEVKRRNRQRHRIETCKTATPVDFL